MKFRFYRFMVSALIILSIGFFSACEEDSTAPYNNTLLDGIDDNGFSIFKEALRASNLYDDLVTDTLTMFAPTDAAFEAAGITLENVASVPNLEDIIEYHIIFGNETSSDLSAGSYMTYNGQSFELSGSLVLTGPNNSVSVTTPNDIEVDNGVIHSVDGILIPLFNVVEEVVPDSELSSLVGALSRFPSILNSLSDEDGEFTVFAPTNAAFDALLPLIGQTSLDDVPDAVLEEILTYHVLTSTVLSSQLTDGAMPTTLQGEDLMVAASGGSFTINGAGIDEADIEVINGVIHKVDAVLVPPSITKYVGTVLEPAYFNSDFTTLVAAIAAADPSIEAILLDANSTVTVFAPTNAAFAAAGITTLPEQAVLDVVLQYHVLGSIVLAADLPTTTVAAPATITTFGGEDFFLTNIDGGDGVYINGMTEVVATDIEKSNGVVHVIDRTLVPPSDDISIIIEENFEELDTALSVAGLKSVIAAGEPFTIFAPSNAALNALYTELGVDGPEDINPATLAEILTYHVFDGGRVFSTDLEDGLEVTSLETTTFVVNIDTDVTINDANLGSDPATVNIVNLLGTNGVVHGIDKVLLPN